MTQEEIARAASVEVTKRRNGLTRNAALVTFTSLAGFTLVNMDSSFFTFSYPTIMKELHISIQQISYLYTGIFIIGAIATFIFGPILDRFGRKVVFQFALYATAIGSLVSALGFNFGSLFAFRGITQIGASSEWMSGQVMVAEEASSQSRGWWVGFSQIGWPVGWFIASLLSLVVIPTLGWRWLFVIGLIPALFVLWVRRNVKETERFRDLKRVLDRGESTSQVQTRFRVDTSRANKFTYRQLFERDLIRTSLLISLWQLIYNYGCASIINWLPTITTDHHIASSSVFGTSAWGSGVGIFGYLTAAYLGEKFGRREVSAVFLILGSAAGLLLAFDAANWATLTLFYALYYFFTIGQMGAAVAFALESFPTRARGTGGTLLSVATSVGFIFAGLTGSVLFSHMGVNQTIFIWGFLCSLVPGLLALVQKESSPEQTLRKLRFDASEAGIEEDESNDHHQYGQGSDRQFSIRLHVDSRTPALTF
ncbi:MFS transporter [Alicyclobacillus cycloheptanicus]|uniref:MFS transporter n=1 Tax=Alicyclobacillus cycloheptanicus TaxID=1457 RepID=A0ABT9XF45_9BACL|nr:MFS transporter [Alicyclobacillus cycloheptanicus]MDQ0188921.1 putative MFS transporter [Alicyclobacillus cycloheptanicus]WDM01730.1 MFS transporter [Alicyclobacillus cycloheptanicus]